MCFFQKQSGSAQTQNTQRDIITAKERLSRERLQKYLQKDSFFHKHERLANWLALFLIFVFCLVVPLFGGFWLIMYLLEHIAFFIIALMLVVFLIAAWIFGAQP